MNWQKGDLLQRKSDINFYRSELFKNVILQYVEPGVTSGTFRAKVIKSETDQCRVGITDVFTSSYWEPALQQTKPAEPIHKRKLRIEWKHGERVKY
jgi:hypothetical protein